MCGIVAMISKSPSGFVHSDLDMFQSMLVSDSIRGEDSTGVFGIYKNKQARILKQAVEPQLMFRCDEWGDFRTKAINSMNVLVGHNRYATRGAVNTENAHPFAEGKICLVHNGTLHNQKDFNKEVEVDSHAIAHAFNEKPAKEVLSQINGAFAFIWYDRETGKLNITRNSERPLAYIETSDMIYIASEGGMIEWLVNRKTSKFQSAKLFDTNKIYSYGLKGAEETESYEAYRPKPSGVVVHTSPKTQHIPNISTTIHGPHAFKFNDEPLIRITELIEVQSNNMIRVRGKTVWPTGGIDFVGIAAPKVNIDDIHALIKSGYATGVVRSTYSTNCGHSLWLGDVKPAETVEMYNNIKIPKTLWKNVVQHHECDKCGGALKENQADMTSFKYKNKLNQYRIVCADCVTESIMGVIDEATSPKQQNSGHEIQGRESVSKDFTDVPFREITEECTLH